MKPGRVGIISDTHGLLRPEALEVLQESELILHAGDVGNLEVLEGLQRIAPVIAVRGNVDGGAWSEQLPPTALVEIGSQNLWMLHDISQLDLNPAQSGFSFVIYGHSHKPAHYTQAGVAYLNPGSAGPRRFRLPISMVQADFSKHPALFRFINLENGVEFTP